MGNLLKEEIIDSAKEFLDAISLRGKYFGSVKKHKWIFRGQKQKYNLIPSAWRETSDFPDLVAAVNEIAFDIFTNYYQITGEAMLAQHFFFISDIRGLPLPEDSQKLRSLIMEYVSTPKVDWPPQELLSLLALAQHHGIPTRLLDWTWNPNIAAYFAAQGATGLPESENKYLEVYAMSMEIFDSNYYKSLKLTTAPNYSIEQVTAPGAGNSNLTAQEGVFTHIRFNDITLDKDINRLSIEGFIENLNSKTSVPLNSPICYRFCLPNKEAKQLLAFLSQEGFTGSKIFPGFDGVVKEIRDKQLLL